MCAIENGGCSQICENALGKVLCKCREDYILDENGKNCRICRFLKSNNKRLLIHSK